MHNTARKLSVPSNHLHQSLTHRNLPPNESPTHSAKIASCDKQVNDSLELARPSSLVRNIQILKSVYDAPNVGITLWGGLEAGLKGTIYISQVAKSSLAEKNNLSVGDQILSANYTSFLDPNITCQKATHIICLEKCLNLTVLPSREIALSQRRHHNYAWIDPKGRSISPPPSNAGYLFTSEAKSFGPSSLLSSRLTLASKNIDQEIREVKLTVEKGVSPGLTIRGGLEYGLGIYVTGIEANSSAEKAGLKVGDKILSVNNIDFRNVIHDEAVEILGSSPRLTMQVKYIGKVPESSASFIKEDESNKERENLFRDFNTTNQSSSFVKYNNKSTNSQNDLLRLMQISNNIIRQQATHSASSNLHSYQEKNKSLEIVAPTLLITGSSDGEILEEKLESILSENEQITFAFYQNEYNTKRMTVDAFFAFLLELLNTREKYLLLNHIRSIIRNEDIDKFDELLFKREEQLKSGVNLQDSGQYLSSNEDSSESSIYFGQDLALTATVDKKASKEFITNESDNLISMQSTKRNLAKENAGQSLFNLNLPAHRDNFNKNILRRHSNCVSSKLQHSNGNHLIISNSDERRWSIAAPHESSMDSKFNYIDQRLKQMPASSGADIKSVCAQDLRASNNHIQRLIKEEDEFIEESSSSQSEAILNHSGVRRHRSLPIPSLTKFPMSSKAFQIQSYRSSSFRLPQRRSVQESDGKLRVTIKKSRPILGIAIEGGSDVNNQPQPRIISIHSSGSAFDTGDLHVGHIILEVDGIDTKDFSHEQIAQVIANAYYNTPHKDYIEFLVRKKSKNEFDMRKSSFMLVNNSFE